MYHFSVWKVWKMSTYLGNETHFGKKKRGLNYFSTITSLAQTP